MDAESLPVGDAKPPLTFSHFPTRQQAFIWRNWGMVSPQRLAAVLLTDESTVVGLAEGMGLRVPPVVGEEWLKRGCVTIIRGNWHLLPYEQLLQLLDWTPQTMAYLLKEEDFLWYKMGLQKPIVEPLRAIPLTPEQEAQTCVLTTVVEKHFPASEATLREPAFGFLERFETRHGHTNAMDTNPRGDENVGLRFIYAYAAVYGDTVMDVSLDPYPEGLLERYAELGIMGSGYSRFCIHLVPIPGAPSYSEGYQTRLENLRGLTERAVAYGIGVYLYYNEPRGMPGSFFETHPEWRGMASSREDRVTCCTSQPAVFEYLRGGTEELFRAVPDLPGLFTITMSENLTNCLSRITGIPVCPRCVERPPAELIAETTNTIEEGAHCVAPDARVLAWTWGWHHDWSGEVVDRLNPGVEVMCTSEEALPVNVGGIANQVIDYTISQVGPSPYCRALWKRARRRGLKTAAKMQINTTWECGGMPYLPVPYLVKEHLDGVRDAGVDGLMLSWTLGGCPSPKLELCSSSPEAIAAQRYGAAAPEVVKAWKAFSEAFREFPFSVGVVYSAPSNQGCANLLYPESTGYTACMVTYPHDDLEAWRSIYPEDVFENQFFKLTEGWKAGLGLLDDIRRDHGSSSELDELDRVAWAVYCHMRSTWLQIRFIRRRDEIGFTVDEMFRDVLEEEIELAKTLHRLASQDSRIGFEASNHYFYTLNELREKEINCTWLRGEGMVFGTA